MPDGTVTIERGGEAIPARGNITGKTETPSGTTARIVLAPIALQDGDVIRAADGTRWAFHGFTPWSESDGTLNHLEIFAEPATV